MRKNRIVDKMAFYDFERELFLISDFFGLFSRRFWIVRAKSRRTWNSGVGRYFFYLVRLKIFTIALVQAHWLPWYPISYEEKTLAHILWENSVIQTFPWRWTELVQSWSQLRWITMSRNRHRGYPDGMLWGRGGVWGCLATHPRTLCIFPTLIWTIWWFIPNTL